MRKRLSNYLKLKIIFLSI